MLKPTHISKNCYLKYEMSMIKKDYQQGMINPSWIFQLTFNVKF